MMRPTQRLQSLQAAQRVDFFVCRLEITSEVIWYRQTP
jgi:hypothetical protein